jgi:hypothetical protein
VLMAHVHASVQGLTSLLWFVASSFALLVTGRSQGRPTLQVYNIYYIMIPVPCLCVLIPSFITLLDINFMI